MIKLNTDGIRNIKYFQHYITVNGIKQFVLAYLKPESDKVLLNIQASPTEVETLSAPLFLPEYPSCNMIFFDQRGSGKTQFINKTNSDEITLDNIITDLYELIQFIKTELKIPKVILVGKDFGTIIAHEFVLKYPKEVSAVISISSIISFMESEKKIIETLNTIITQKGLDKDKKVLKELIDSGYPSNNSIEDLFNNRKLLRTLLWTYTPSYSNSLSKYKVLRKSYTMKFKDLKWIKEQSKTSFNDNINLLQVYRNYDISKEDLYPTPVYFISGEKDFENPVSIVEDHFKKLKNPKAEMYIIPFSEKNPHIDNTKEYWNVINAILFNLFNTPIKG